MVANDWCIKSLLSSLLIEQIKVHSMPLQCDFTFSHGTAFKNEPLHDKTNNLGF